MLMAFQCKYMEGCPMYDLITTSVRIMRLQPYLNEYCLSEVKHRTCARLKIIETGKEPSSKLLPDGEILKV